MIRYYHESKSRRSSNQLRAVARTMRSNKKLLWLALAILVLIGVFRYFYDKSLPYSLQRESKYILGFNSKKITYNRDMPLIFIGGVPRSGCFIAHFTTFKMFIFIFLLLTRHNFNASHARCSPRG